MTTALAPLKNDTIAKLLEDNKEELRKVLPKHLTMDRLLKVVLYSVMQNSDLLKCTQASLMSCIKQCVELGLEPGGVRGLAYFIPFKVGGADLGRLCTLVIGYRGLCQLARRSGTVHDIEARVVFANDRFDYEFGLTPRLRHVPALTNPGEPVAVYCVARLQRGAVHVEVMSAAEVLAIKARSPGARKPDSPWNSPDKTDRYREFQMWRKTVIRRTANYLDLSPEVARAFELDDEQETRMAEIEVTAPPLPKSAAKTMPADTATDAEVIEEPKDAAPAETPTEPKAAAEPETIARPTIGTAMHAEWLVFRMGKLATMAELSALLPETAQVPKDRKSQVNQAYSDAKKRLTPAEAK